MEMQIAKGWWAIVVGFGMVAALALMGWYFGDNAAFRAWLDTPVREARIRDLAPLLFVAALLAK